MVIWTLWTSRNKWVIEGMLPRYPADLLFKTNAFLQKWKVLLREGDQTKIKDWARQEMYIDLPGGNKAATT